MPRHQIPTDRTIVDPFGIPVANRDVVEISGAGVASMTDNGSGQPVDIEISGGAAVVPASGFYGRMRLVQTFFNGASITSATTRVDLVTNQASDVEEGASFDSVYTDLANGEVYFSESGLYSVFLGMETQAGWPSATQRFSVSITVSKASASAAGYQDVEAAWEPRTEGTVDRAASECHLVDWFEPEDGFLMNVRVPSNFTSLSNVVSSHLRIAKII